jgi:peroxiredoxin Q/BCP
LQSLEQQLQRLEAADTQVLGVSMDSIFANAAFAEQIKISYPLLSDKNGSVTRRYGLLNASINAARRASFFIDKTGKILEIYLDHYALDPSKLADSCERRKLQH